MITDSNHALFAKKSGCGVQEEVLKGVYFPDIALAVWNCPFMARPLRIEFLGAVYHISNRGNEKMEEAVERYGYTQREVADYLGMHLSPLSRIMREKKGMLTK